MKTDKSYNINKRRFRIITAISTVVVIVIAVFAVLLCYKLDWSFDMTIERLFTLSEQSVKVLDDLDQQVRIAGVYPTGKEEQMVKSLLDEYVSTSDRISVEYIDIEKEPAKLAGYQLNVAAVTNGSIIVESGTRSKIIDKTLLFEDTGDGGAFNGEREITGAIRYVTSQEMPVVYFVQGNGEIDPSATMTKAVASLEQDAFEMRTLRLTEISAIPDDAALLVFTSPKSDITLDELDMLEAYTLKGGSIFLMIDAVMNSNDVMYDNFNKLTNGFGIGIVNNYVVEEDPTYYLSQYKLYLIPQFGKHEITEQIAGQGNMVILPVVRGLGTIDFDESDITNTILLQSSNKSWIRVDMSITDTSQTENDYIGPAPLAYASVKSNVKWGQKAARLVVIGNSAFAQDGNIEVKANRDFFLNCVYWTSGSRDSDAIASKSINSGAMIIRGNEFTGLAIVCIAVLPSLAFIAAFVVWTIRRNQ
jgi:ABC-type uncharacterized transport system involved in gliding motility auxiliary subunit